MTILASLEQAYKRLDRAPPFGYAITNIGYCIVLKRDGSPAREPISFKNRVGNRDVPRRMGVPTPLVQRTSAVRPNFLWDKSIYSLGVTGVDKGKSRGEHQAFVRFHRTWLAHSDDAGLVSFRKFLDSWEPSEFSRIDWPQEMLDANIVFALSDEYQNCFLHERDAAKEIWGRVLSAELADDALCLVSGQFGRVARSHPPIKGVDNTQSSGAFIVSNDGSAFTSYEHEGGMNAPVSEAAAFAYTTALNHFLRRDSGHRVQIGDASTVFWAEASDEAAARLAEQVVASVFSGPPKADDIARSMERAETKTVGIVLQKLREGRTLGEAEPKLAKGVRFFVLGLAPNAARISVRFWLEDDFAHLTENFQRFWDDMAIEPPPPGPPPVLWQYLNETAVLGKRENVQPNLAGEWMRAILAGTPYPMTLLATVLMRIRADGEVNGRRVAILKALLRRNFHRSEEEAPVALDATNRNRGYLLGRLFAAYEQAQSAALGRSVNATIKDKFYGAASAQPRKVFPMLESGSANHLSKLGKARPGQRVNLEKAIAEIMDLMEPGSDPFPASLAAADQALFGLGYYHQRSRFFARPVAATETETLP